MKAVSGIAATSATPHELESATLRVTARHARIVESVAIDFPPRIVKCEELLNETLRGEGQEKGNVIREGKASEFNARNLLISNDLAPRAGFEPATLRLTAGCSAVELPRNIGCAGRSAPRGRGVVTASCSLQAHRALGKTSDSRLGTPLRATGR